MKCVAAPTPPPAPDQLAIMLNAVAVQIEALAKAHYDRGFEGLIVRDAWNRMADNLRRATPGSAPQ
jgi:hypothetical protein